MSDVNFTRQDVPDVPIGPYVKRQLDQVGSKLRTFAGVDVSNYDSTIAISDDEVVKRVKHVLKKGEALGTFYARTGLGRAQILTMSKDEISRFVAVADANNADTGFSPTITPPQRQDVPRVVPVF